MNSKNSTIITLVGLNFCSGCNSSSEIQWDDIEWGLGYEVVVDRRFFKENKLKRDRVTRYGVQYKFCDDCGFFGLVKNVKIEFCANNQYEIRSIVKKYQHRPITEAEFHSASKRLADHLGIVWSRRGSNVFYGIKRWSADWIGEIDGGWRYVNIGSFDTGLARVYFRRECSV